MSPFTAISQDMSLAAAAAEDAVARLDERLATSPIRDGFRARTHIADACASLWVDGELVHVEDLVLHDAAMDVRTPTAELVTAQSVLRARRRVAGAAPGWSYGAGLASLRGLDTADPEPRHTADAIAVEDDALAMELAAIDALIARSSQVLKTKVLETRVRADRDPIVYDQDWDTANRLDTWRSVLSHSDVHPPIVAAAIAAEAWERLGPLQHMSWLGRLIIPDLLRVRHKTRAHLMCLSSGLKAVPRDRRRHRDPDVRLAAWISAIAAAAEQGLRDHDRWLQARYQLERRLVGRRLTSKLPRLIDLIMATPVASAGLIAAELGVTPRAAQTLVKDLGLRETTGRGRYRAWGVI
jgi:hypothetical protein